MDAHYPTNLEVWQHGRVIAVQNYGGTVCTAVMQYKGVCYEIAGTVELAEKHPQAPAKPVEFLDV